VSLRSRTGTHSPTNAFGSSARWRFVVAETGGGAGRGRAGFVDYRDLPAVMIHRRAKREAPQLHADALGNRARLRVWEPRAGGRGLGVGGAYRAQACGRNALRVRWS
jgi:hypothetical protein